MDVKQAQEHFTGQLVELVASKVGQSRAVHPETAIAVVSRLAGSLLLRSFDLPLQGYEPGSVLLSEQANEKGPMLVSILGSYLAASQIQFAGPDATGAASSRGTPPNLDVVGSLSLVQKEALALAASNSLSLEQAAQSAAVATGFVVKECARQIGAQIAFNAAVFGFIEGSKTVPPRIASGPSERTIEQRRPWYKLW